MVGAPVGGLGFNSEDAELPEGFVKEFFTEPGAKTGSFVYRNVKTNTRYKTVKECWDAFEGGKRR